MPIRSYLLAVFLALFAGIASAQEPKHRPPGAQESSQIQLMLETGGHTALIRALDFTPDETRLVSVSEDKTIRV